MTTNYHLIIDLEATCCNDASFPKEEMEIIEIGAVMVSQETQTIISEFQSFVQPVRHPQLTDFCKELTTISQAEVDAALGFKEVMQEFQKWTSAFENFDFGSWGNYDLNQLIQDCRFHQIPFFINVASHRNLKEEFSKFLGVSKRYGMSKALTKVGLKLEGRHHRGIDDARNIARILIYMGGERDHGNHS